MSSPLGRVSQAPNSPDVPVVGDSPPSSAVNGDASVARPPPADGTGRNTTTLFTLGVGIGIGVTIMLVIMGIYVIWYKRRKRRHGRDEEFAPKDDPFRHPQHQGKKSNTPTAPGDNVVGMLSRPSPLPCVLSDSRQFSDGSVTPPPPSTASSLSFDRPLQTPSVDVSRTTFSYEELALATDNFSSTNLLGEGGFGYVYKGFIHNRKKVAIKQLKVGSSQGEREFQAEVETISRVVHKSLVSLDGYCISGPQRLLVYEFVPNKTLEFHLHGRYPPVNWASRLKIALGSAKGLAYLHEECHPKIIHRDIKASNILLDDEFEAKVADFGLAKFYPDTDTHVSTRVMGTFGYLAPEYALTGKLTEKSDVFSFGIVLLELITGRRPVDKSQGSLYDNIVDWARPLLTQALEDKNFGPLTDPRLPTDYDPVEIDRLIICAAVCVRHLARRRPRMSQIVGALEGKTSLEELNQGTRLGTGTMYDGFGSSDYDTAQYKEDMKKFRKLALESEVHNSSDCSGPTSDFGPQPRGSSSEALRTTQATCSASKF